MELIERQAKGTNNNTIGNSGNVFGTLKKQIRNNNTEIIATESEGTEHNMNDVSRNVFHTRNNLTNILEVLDCETDAKRKHPVPGTKRMIH